MRTSSPPLTAHHCRCEHLASIVCCAASAPTPSTMAAPPRLESRPGGCWVRAASAVKATTTSRHRRLEAREGEISLAREQSLWSLCHSGQSHSQTVSDSVRQCQTVRQSVRVSPPSVPSCPAMVEAGAGAGPARRKINMNHQTWRVANTASPRQPVRQQGRHSMSYSSLPALCTTQLCELEMEFLFCTLNVIAERYF